MFYTLKDVYYNRFYKHLTAMMGTFQQIVKSTILRYIDQEIDQTFHIVNQFRRYRLYVPPSAVTVGDMNALDNALLQLTNRNRQGETMSLEQVIAFTWSLHRLLYIYRKTIRRMENALSVHALLRTAFGLDPR